MANRDKQGDFEGVSNVDNIKALAEKARDLASQRVSVGAADSASVTARPASSPSFLARCLVAR